MADQSEKIKPDLSKGSNSNSPGEPVLVDMIKREDPSLLQFIFPDANKKNEAEDARNQDFIPEYRDSQFLGMTDDRRVRMSNVRWGFVESENIDDWKPIFKNASLNYRSLKNIYLVVELFPPELIAGHSLSYFEFSDPDALLADDGSHTNGMVLSIEAKLRYGQTYSVVEGFKDSYNIVYQLGTWKDFVQRSTRRYGRKLVRYRLNLTLWQKLMFLKEGLTRAFLDHTGELYNSLNNSCLTDQIKILNTVTSGKQHINDWIIPDKVFSPAAAIPNGTGLLLYRHDLLDDSPIIITQPDQKFYPDKQFEKSKLEKMFENVSERKWQVGMTVAGAALGFVIPPLGAGELLFGALGGYIGFKASKWLEREANYKTETSESYFERK